MNHGEAVKLCRLVQACCPAQKMDEFTPDAWATLLEDTRYADAELAVREVAKRQPFVAPSEIIAEVRRIRTKRIDEYGPIDPPAHLDPDNARAFIEWERSAKEAIADGNPPARAGELTQRPMAAIEGTFRRPT